MIRSVVLAIRRLQFGSVLLLFSWLLPIACSETGHYRWLSFFFDGVPEPGTPVADRQSRAERLSAGDSTTRIRPVAPDKPILHAHPPYQANRCGACHNREDGQPFKTAQEGLCQGCHEGVPGDVRFVHGPVNDNDCLFCHHYHVSYYAGILRADPTALCLQCHEITDLTEGPHHDSIQRRSCVDCHNPHGGNDRFFLERTDR